MNLKNKECGKGIAKVQQKQRLITYTKLYRNFIENRDYMKSHSVKRVQNKCK